MDSKKEHLLFKLIDILIGDQSSDQGNTDHPLIGEYVIVRCVCAGVHCGELMSIDGRTVIIKGSRRMYKWWCNSEMSLSGVARQGINQSKSKIAGILNKPLILIDACEVIGFENEDALDSVVSASTYNEQ